MPIGLTHIMAAGSHYEPEPWNFETMHNAGPDGIGYDRSDAGSNAVSEYAPAVGGKYNDLAPCPDEYLLWFHHVPWSYTMHSGRTVWDELCFRYNSGVDYVKGMHDQWQTMRGKVDPERWAAVEAKLVKNVKDATVWRDTCIWYFHKKGGNENCPLPAYLNGVADPQPKH
jgi:alpha-glucuronidase